VEEIPRFYAQADAFLVTLKKNEAISYTLPGKVQSYLAAGRPIIGSIDGETRALVDRFDCGVCVPAEDWRALAEAIRRFAADRGAHATMGRNARKCSEEQFSRDRFFPRLEELLEDAARGDR